MPKVHITLQAPSSKAVILGPCAIGKTIEMEILPIGTRMAFQMPFAEGKVDGAQIIHEDGVVEGKIDWYLPIEKRGDVEYHARLTATGIDAKEFRKIVSAPWLSSLGWAVTESVIPG